MSEQPLVDVEACAAKVFTIARALFCLSTEFDERAMAYRLALAENPDRLGDLPGNYAGLPASAVREPANLQEISGGLDLRLPPSIRVDVCRYAAFRELLAGSARNQG